VPRHISAALFIPLAAVGHGTAAFLYFAQREDFGLPSEWDTQFLALIGLSFASSALSFLWRGSPKSKGALAVAILCYLLLCYPLPVSSGLQLIIGMPLMTAVMAAFPLPDYLYIGPLFIALTLLTGKPAILWGRSRAGATIPETVLVASVLGIVYALCAIIREALESRGKALGEMERLDSAIDRISSVNASFQNALVLAEEEYARKERNRITREIHDIVGYALTNQQMMLEAALMLAAPEQGRLRELLSMAREGVAEGLKETRRTLYGLRQADNSRSLDFAVLLQITRNFQAVTGVRVSVEFGNARGDIDQQTWTTVYRLIQESMINAFRHGKAMNISIVFREDDKRFHVAVRDDGEGSSMFAEGIGLKGMRERIASLGGELRAGNAPAGFLVSASVPRRGVGEDDR
jgi:signal transduction histidine kinase